MRKSYSVLIENIFSLLTLRLRDMYSLYFGTIFNSGLRTFAFWNDCIYARYYGIFPIFVDFGYSLTAPKAIAQAEEQKIGSLFAIILWKSIY